MTRTSRKGTEGKGHRGMGQVEGDVEKGGRMKVTSRERTR